MRSGGSWSINLIFHLCKQPQATCLLYEHFHHGLSGGQFWASSWRSWC